MKTVTVHASNTYDVVIGGGVSALLPARLKTLYPGGRVCFVSEDHVAPLHLSALETAAKTAGIDTAHYIFPHGERSKNPAVLLSLLEFLAQEHFTRKDVLVALGGGVTGDLTGLASALFMRGMGLVQMPTTLLSMVDSSVGGKTAVNLDGGKNLCGVFRQPALVLCDLGYLKTLAPEDFADGMAEVVKYGVIADAALFDRVKDGVAPDDLEDVVTRCVEIKRDVVAADEFDTGKRALLNFGHTLAHAIETKSNYQISHGRAVAMGMVRIARIAEAFGYANEPCAGRIAAALEANALPTACPYENKALFPLTTGDKKCAGNSIALVLPSKIGDCLIERMPISRWKELLSA